MNIHHRYFVQYMLKKGITTVHNALAYCRHVSQGQIENITQFKTLIIEINREISKQCYKIVLSVCEVTNDNFVVWLNTKNDEISKYQISYSAIELEYFHAILQEILNSDDHQITFIVCINITSTLTSHFSRDNGQKVLNKWLKGGYYVVQGDYIHLGPRTILEFTAYLRSNRPDSICNLCSEIVFTGKKCGHCNKVLHSHCLATYLSIQNICPCCHNNWIHEANEEEAPREAHMDTNDVLQNHTMPTDDETTQDDDMPMSQVISSNRIQYGQRSSSDEEISDIDKPGPSRRRRRR